VGVARGTFQSALGSSAKLVTTNFNAGPALIEALFASEIDIGYVGPNPAINGYVKSHGEALRIIAGAASGGALFVVRPGANIKTAADLAGKKDCHTSAWWNAGCFIAVLPPAAWFGAGR